MQDFAPILNLAAYHFVALDDRQPLCERLLARGQALGIKGTILLASEGINLFLAGEAAAVRRFWDELTADPRLRELLAKESWSVQVPFKKFKVRLKSEIIRMNHPTIRPQAERAPSVSAHTLRRWLERGHDDQGRAVVLVDTRNDFEVQVGTFVGAQHWQLRKFSEFPQAVAEHRPTLEGKTVVGFCTGGIRCEKAVLYMQDLGLQHCYQLEGGILKYFEEVGSAYFAGACFVFDERIALDGALRSVDATLASRLC